tara:strand:- start:3077 stop:4444 length:1368 start_codon:yes stop_codon:yes gene_type:complete
MKTKYHITLLIVALSLCSFSAYAKEPQSKFLNIQNVTTPTNITAWLVEDHSIPVIAMAYSFRGAGSKNDPAGKQGLARLASNTMDEGAGDITSQIFQKTLRDNSISLSFSASRDNFGGGLKTLSANKEIAFNLLKLALTKPRFDQDPVDRMRESNKSRIKSSLSNPRWIAARIQNDRIFENHPYALNSGGTLSSLDAITPDDLRGFHKTLGKNELVIGVAGDINAEELKAVLDDVFGSMPDVTVKAAEKSPLQNAGKTYLYKQDIPQSVIEISQAGISRQDKGYYAAHIMNFILGESGFGSRLMEEIREKRGLTYGVYSYFRQYDEADVLHVSTSTVNKSVPEMRSLINQEWQKMQDTPVSEQEITDAKSYLIGSLPLSLTSTGSIAGVLLSLQLDHLPIDYLDQRAAQLNAVQISDIQAIAKRLLNKDSMTTVIVGNPEEIENVNIITDLPNVE